MEGIFLNIINFSITATYIAVAVMLIRLCIKKAPKWISGVLWGFVGLRLLFPFSIESIFSLIPNNKPIPDNITTMPKPEIDSGIPIINDTFNPIISDTFAPPPEASVNPMEVLMTVASYVWLIGIAAMLIYMAISFLRVRLNVRGAVRLEGNIYECKSIQTAFILGVIRPRIYTPAQMDKADLEFVVAHEKAHIKRLDHIWKPLGFLLLAVYWFNPVLWVAYVLLCRDIELACDEKVLKKMGIESKKRYSTALVNCSVENKMITACPLAFGEVGIKERVMRILNYKKPAFWVVCLSLVAVAVVAVCFLTDPIRNDPSVEGTPTPSVTETPMPNITQPIPTPNMYPDVDTIPLDDGLIDSMIEFFNVHKMSYSSRNSLGDKLLQITAYDEQAFLLTFDPYDYYFACAYDNEYNLDLYELYHERKYLYAWNDAKYFADKCTWIGFKEPNDIPQYYNGKRLVLAVQVNKSTSCLDVLTGKETVAEHFMCFETLFSGDFNYAQQELFSGTLMIHTRVKDDTVYFSSDHRYFSNWNEIPTIIRDGQCYIKQPLYTLYTDGTRYDIDLDHELWKFREDLEKIMITDMNVFSTGTESVHFYALFKPEDIAKIIEKYKES